MTVLDADLRVDASTSSQLSHTSVPALRAWICAGIFVLLMVWAYFFPYSGDGDSVLHYLNARDTSLHWVSALYAWSRPGFKIPLSFFASHGIMAAHVFCAAITAAAVWNTMRLAEELQIPRSWVAGLLLIAQPFVFALGSDTMTEMPLALGLVLAIRWWRNGRHVLACLLVGYLPSVRPEGFFFGVIFGVMVLALLRRGRNFNANQNASDGVLKLLGLLACLSAGMIAWVILCWIFSSNHDPLMFLHYWSWPMGSYSAYGTGKIYYYLINWPLYCGLPLFGLFMVGIIPSLRRPMLLPWVLWTTVIGVHTILYWRGLFASCGLIRIMACSSPVTALICLYGANAVANELHRIARWPAAIVFGIAAVAWAVGNYCLSREHMHFLPIQRCAAFIQREHLLDNKPWFFTGDKIATAMLAGPNLPDDKLMTMDCDRDKIHKSLAALPIGSIGVWDNEQAPVWHGHSTDELVYSCGFTILYETHVKVYSFASLLQGKWQLDMRYVVLRKDSEGK